MRLGRRAWLKDCATAFLRSSDPIPGMHKDWHPVNAVNHVQIVSSGSLDRINRILVLAVDEFPVTTGCPARSDDPFASAQHSRNQTYVKSCNVAG